MPIKRKICVVTGSRADYGLLFWTLKQLQSDRAFELQLCVTGMHLSPEFGLTVREIEADQFKINKKIETLLSSDSANGIAKSIALGIAGFAEAYNDLKPDILLVLGDRFETYAAVVAALPYRIPVAHCHGGESTEGAIDEAIRHSITKMAHLHFVSTPQYARRVVQLGEFPSRVFLVGALGLENIKKLRLLSKVKLEKRLGVKFLPKSILVTFHPVTLDAQSPDVQFSEVLSALKGLKDTSVIFTLPNADGGGRVLISMIDTFVGKNSHFAYSFVSLGSLLYLSLLKHVDIVLGNSSSGIIEAPSLKTATINLGDRQKGRIRARSVLDVPTEKALISRAIKKCLSSKFQEIVEKAPNPYDHGVSSKLITGKLREIEIEPLIKKSFHNVKMFR